MSDNMNFRRLSEEEFARVMGKLKDTPAALRHLEEACHMVMLKLDDKVYFVMMTRYATIDALAIENPLIYSLSRFGDTGVTCGTPAIAMVYSYFSATLAEIEKMDIKERQRYAIFIDGVMAAFQSQMVVGTQIISLVPRNTLADLGGSDNKDYIN